MKWLGLMLSDHSESIKDGRLVDTTLKVSDISNF